MREMLLSTPVTGIFICLAAYEVGVQINKKLKNPIANPMLIGIVLAAVVLSVCNIPLEAFDLGGDMINMLLTPATAVCPPTGSARFCRRTSCRWCWAAWWAA